MIPEIKGLHRLQESLPHFPRVLAKMELVPAGQTQVVPQPVNAPVAGRGYGIIVKSNQSYYEVPTGAAANFQSGISGFVKKAQHWAIMGGCGQ